MSFRPPYANGFTRPVNIILYVYTLRYFYIKYILNGLYKERFHIGVHMVDGLCV